MKKILFLTSNFPKPLNSGGKLRDYYIMEYLSKKFEISLVGFKEEYVKENDVFLPFVPASRCHVVKGTKEIDLITFFRKRYWPLWCLVYYAAELEEMLDEIIKKDHFDYIHVSHSYMAHYVLKYNNIIRVIDHHNVKTDLYRDALSKTNNIIKKVDYAAEYYKWFQYQREVLGHFEFHTACSVDEQKALKSFVKAPVVLLASGVDTDHFYPKTEENIGYNLFFTGSLDYFANHEAIFFFCKEVLPIIRKSIPNVVFQIVGREPRKSLEALLANTPNAWFSYNVKDIRPFYYQSTLFVVPLLDGAGTRLKIMEALATGLPVVSTSKGCEGLGLKQGEGITIVDEPKEMAEAIILLLTNSQKRKEFQQKACDLARERFSWERVLKSLDTIYI